MRVTGDDVRRRMLAVALGGEVEDAVRPVVAVSFVYNVAFATFWVYVGVFALEGLHWKPGDVGLLFLLSAPVAAVANYLAGHLSDRLGRKWPIVFSFLAAGTTVALLTLVSDRIAFAFALIILLGLVGAPAYSLDRVLVADVVEVEEARERAYAAVRVAANLGAFVGPPLAAVFIHFGGWDAFLLAIAVCGGIGAAVSAFFLPADRRRTETKADPTTGGLRLLARDRPFLLLLLSTLLGFVVYCGFETVLPVIAVSAYGLSPATWGLLVAISPLMVVFLQLRLTNAAARFAPAARLTAAALLMGLPFLVLILAHPIAVIAAVIVVFVVGEMLWVPTSQVIAARLAPPASRGTYFGALAAMTGPAWTLTPLVALQLRGHAGVASVWLLLAAAAVASALAGVTAIRAATVTAARPA
jgi:predicted MFS family arabinose efflux permease